MNTCTLCNGSGQIKILETPALYDKCTCAKYYALNVLLKRFQRGSTYGIRDEEYRNILLSEGATQTYMNCIGFIAGIYYSGNIDLAAILASNFVEQFYWLAHGEGSYAEVTTDNDSMSFNFVRYSSIDEPTYNGIIAAGGRAHKVPYAFRHNYYAFMYNGGIIFHGNRYLHCLDKYGDDHKWWSTHT